MNHIVNFTIPQRTISTSPERTDYHPGEGYLKTVTVFFPPGCLNQVGIKILANGYAPLHPGWISGNNERYIIDYYRRLEGPPYLITILGYNNAVDWEHTPKIMFVMER